MPEIGTTLREARMRARIDVSEIEAQTKIRAKYLRALENEEWDLLPGPTFVKSFLRTYGDALGLDGKALVEEFKLNHERPSEGERPELGQPPPVAGRSPLGRRRSGGGGGGGAGAGGHRRTGRPPEAGPSRWYIAAVAGVGLLIVLLLVGLLSGGKGSSNPSSGAGVHTSSAARSGGGHRTGHPASTAASTGSGALVALKLEPTAAVYVCLIGDGRRRIPGLILQPGAGGPTYHARRFEITLGNNAVSLIVDGTPRTVPPSSQAIAYSITKAGRRTLAPAEAPTCTGP
jgi:cytoskeleton protein RodZ